MRNSGFHDEILQQRGINWRWDEYYPLTKLNEEILSLTRELELILFLRVNISLDAMESRVYFFPGLLGPFLIQRTVVQE